MRDEKLGCPITISDYERYAKNKEVYDKLTDEQKDWLEDLFENYNYSFVDNILKIGEDGLLWVICNTPNGKRRSRW